jgi:putative hydrolase of HD superfamily
MLRMNRSFAAALAALSLAGLPGAQAQVSQPVATEEGARMAVARRIDAFNAHDIDAYVAAHAENLGIYEYPDRQLASQREHLRRIFGPGLERGEGSVDVLGQWVLGNVVVSEEILKRPGRTEHLIILYTVENGLIAEYRLIEGA